MFVKAPINEAFGKIFPKINSDLQAQNSILISNLDAV